MVDKWGADRFGPSTERACKRDVLLARGGVRAGVVVNENECARRLLERYAKDIAYADVEAVDAARCYATSGPQAVSSIEAEHPKLLVI